MSLENTAGKGEIALENTVGKVEIARNEQFLLFLQCFFYPIGELSVTFIKLEIIGCRLFQTLSVWKSLIVLWERVNTEDSVDQRLTCTLCAVRS